MPNITLNTHIITKHDTAQNWANSSYIPYDGEIVISSNNTGTPYGRNQTELKIGNGVDSVSNIAGVYPINSLRYVTCSGGRISLSAYGNAGMNINDYALVVANGNYPTPKVGSIVQVSEIEAYSTYPDGSTGYFIDYKTVWSPPSASATPSLYCHTLTISARGTGSASLNPNQIYLSIPGIVVYSSKSNFTSSDFDNYPQMRVAGGKFTESGPNHYTYNFSGINILPDSGYVYGYCTNGSTITFEYTGATATSSHQV